MDRTEKRKLRDINLSVWDGNQDVFPVQKNQDSSLKKNTAFIKRLRTSIGSTSSEAFIQDVKSLSLHKYLSEIISACYEGLCKLKTPAEIATGIEIISALHQRFGPTEFTGCLGWYIGCGLVSPDKSLLKTLSPEAREREEKERLVRQQSLLCVATELWLAGVLRSLADVIRPEFESKSKLPLGSSNGLHSKSKPGHTPTKPSNVEEDPFPLEVLKDLLGHDRDHVNLPIVVLFIKTFSFDVFGAQTQADDQVDLPMTTSDTQQMFRNVMTRYFDDVKAHVIRDQKSLISQEKRNAEAYVRSGEVFEDRQTNFEKQSKAQDKLLANLHIISELLALPMPDLKEKSDSMSNGDAIIGLIKAGEYLKNQSDGPGIWEDEEERRFYESLPNLKDKVPSILFDEPKKKKNDDDQVGKKASSSLPETGVAPSEEVDDNIDDQNTAISNKSIGAQVDGLLARLPDLHTKDMVDSFATDFCFVNSKASRNRLTKSLQDLPKGRTDLLPFYARIIAILSRYMPDVSQGVISHLDEEFRSLQRRKSKEFLGGVRRMNVRYMAELTKFGIVPEHVIFHCLKVCLDDLSGNNIETMANLMENCGRYLLRSPDSCSQMTSFLEALHKRKSAQHLEQRDRMVLENAIYHVSPPDRPAIEQKDRSPIELYIQKVLREDMNDKSHEWVARQLRKLHWNEHETKVILHKYLSRPWKIKYDHVHLLAGVVALLNDHYPSFSPQIVDELLESILVGLQVSDVKYNQRRFVEIKYIGELYVYKLVDSAAILDLMYRIINFNYDPVTSKVTVDNPVDMSYDFFRIRLICTLLETCTAYLPKKKLNFFIICFQYYINVKDVLSLEIEQAIQGAFAAISNTLKITATSQEAFDAVIEAKKLEHQLGDKEGNVEEVEEDRKTPELPGDGEEDSGSDIDAKDHREETDTHTEEEDGLVEVDSDVELSEFMSDSMDSREPIEDPEFDRELQKLMSDSTDSRKLERRADFDVPLPLRRGPRDEAFSESKSESPVTGQSFVQFSLLTKRGNKQQIKNIDLPANSNFAVTIKKQQEAEKEEKNRLKQYVLSLEQLRDDTETDELNTLEKNVPNPHLQPKFERGGRVKGPQRGRQLQASDFAWD